MIGELVVWRLKNTVIENIKLYPLSEYPLNRMSGFIMARDLISFSVSLSPHISGPNLCFHYKLKAKWQERQ